MPIYEYRCKECGGSFEALLHRLDGEIIKCPSCGSEDVEKMFSSYAIMMGASTTGTTCCGRTERCEAPPCSTGDICHRI